MRKKVYFFSSHLKQERTINHRNVDEQTDKSTIQFSAEHLVYRQATEEPNSNLLSSIAIITKTWSCLKYSISHYPHSLAHTILKTREISQVASISFAMETYCHNQAREVLFRDDNCRLKQCVSVAMVVWSFFNRQYFK